MKVSVIIPTYNRRRWIEKCLDSVLTQTYDDMEIIVVDDRSTDDTVEWLQAQKKYEGVLIHVQEENGGASVARNTGIGIAQGDLIVFIDSDDMLMPDHVAKAVEAFEKHPDLGLFCCDSRMIDAEGNIILNGKTWHEALRDAKNVDVLTGLRRLDDVFQYSNCFPGFTLRREVLEELGGFDQSIFPADDYDLALRVAASRWKVFYLHEPLCLRREHDGQCSGIRNSVKTQVKLIEALERSLQNDPEQLTDKLVRRRLAEIKMERGISEVLEGKTVSGMKHVIGSVISEPAQFRVLTGIGGRKVRRMIRR